MFLNCILIRSWWQPEIRDSLTSWGKGSWNLPLFAGIYPSKRWLALVFRNHQQYLHWFLANLSVEKRLVAKHPPKPRKYILQYIVQPILGDCIIPTTLCQNMNKNSTEYLIVGATTVSFIKMWWTVEYRSMSTPASNHSLFAHTTPLVTQSFPYC